MLQLQLLSMKITKWIATEAKNNKTENHQIIT